LNNRELLIKILIELRSNGINNKKLLNLIEQMPPHYFIDILKKYKTLKNVTLGEIVSIAKIFNLLLKDVNKIDNFFISGIKAGWSLTLAAKISKRVFCILNKDVDRKNLNHVFYQTNIKNIFLKKGSGLQDWSAVSPFDVILITKPVNKIPDTIIKFISDKGMIFVPLYKDENIKMIKINKHNYIQETDINFNLLNSCIL